MLASSVPKKILPRDRRAVPSILMLSPGAPLWMYQMMASSKDSPSVHFSLFKTSLGKTMCHESASGLIIFSVVWSGTEFRVQNARNECLRGLAALSEGLEFLLDLVCQLADLVEVLLLGRPLRVDDAEYLDLGASEELLDVLNRPA